MPPHPATRIADWFVDLVDPRISRCRRHDRLDIVTIAVCAVISGADTFVDIADWGHAKRDWLEDWLALPNGIPSHETFGRVFPGSTRTSSPGGSCAWCRRWSPLRQVTGKEPTTMVRSYVSSRSGTA
jgi:hypothetical protein